MGEAEREITLEKKYTAIEKIARITGVSLVTGGAAFGAAELLYHQHSNDAVNPPAKVGAPFAKETASFTPQDTLRPSQTPTLPGSAFSAPFVEASTPQSIVTEIPHAETPIAWPTSETKERLTYEEIADLRTQFARFLNVDAAPQLKQTLDSLTSLNTPVLQRTSDKSGDLVRFKIPVFNEPDPSSWSGPGDIEYDVSYDADNRIKSFTIHVYINGQGELAPLSDEEYLKMQEIGLSEVQLRANAMKFFQMPQDMQSGWGKGIWVGSEGSSNQGIGYFNANAQDHSFYYLGVLPSGLAYLNVSDIQLSWPGDEEGILRGFHLSGELPNP